MGRRMFYDQPFILQRIFSTSTRAFSWSSTSLRDLHFTYDMITVLAQPANVTGACGHHQLKILLRDAHFA